MAHIVKLNDEELEYAGGGAGADALWQDLRQHGVRALIVTHAERGAEVFTPTAHVETPAPKVDVRDTTGAGDGFVAGLITGILRRSGARTPHDALGSFDERDWTAVLSLGCHVGSMVCRSLGATPSLPNAADIPWAELDFHD